MSERVDAEQTIEMDLPLFRLAQAAPVTEPEPIPANKHASAIIERLERGPASCREIDRLTPARGQALVHALREIGYEIETIILENNRKGYRYRGFFPTVKVSKSMQEAYYRTPHWREMARKRKEIDNFTCQQCGCSGSQANPLETHHWVYELFAECAERELVTLCRECHENIHHWIRGGACHFPRKVAQHIARRLGWEPKQ